MTHISIPPAGRIADFVRGLDSFYQIHILNVNLKRNLCLIPKSIISSKLNKEINLAHGFNKGAFFFGFLWFGYL
jgi:hypothetical protein